jgi:hypothetical protein
VRATLCRICLDRRRTAILLSHRQLGREFGRRQARDDVARFVKEAFAFTAHLDKLKARHNGGRDFPVTNRKLRTGRPPGR